MTENTIAASIRVFVRRECDGYYASSPQVPGLSVWGTSDYEMRDRVTKGIKLLYKHNHGIDVTVIHAADPMTMRPSRDNPAFSDFVLAAAA
jgi:hypothetical protein